MNDQDIYRYWKKQKRRFRSPLAIFSEVLLIFTRYQELAANLRSIQVFFSNPDGARRELKKPGMIKALTNPDNLMLRALWGGVWAPVVADAVSRRLEGICQWGWNRRAFRSSRDFTLYASVVESTLGCFLQVREYRFTLRTLLEFYFSKPEYFEPMSAFNSEIIPMLIASALDREDPYVTEECRKAIYENSTKVTHPLILGLFFSRKESSWKMAADLLIAARLQEGLRQAIVELCSDGNLPAFRYMLKVMLDQNMIRFASVVRAFDVWTGLGFEATRAAAVKHAFEEACELLLDESLQEEAIAGGNPMRVYLGLWALGNRECAEARGRVLHLVKKQDTPLSEKCACLSFLATSDFRFKVAEAVQIMKESGDELILWGCMLPLLEEADGKRFFPASPGERKQLYRDLKRILLLLPSKKSKRKHPVFDWLELELSQERIAFALLALAGLSWDEETVGDLLESAPKLPTPVRQMVYSEVLEYLPRFPRPFRFMEGKRRRRFPVREQGRKLLLAGLSDRSSAIRNTALQLFGRLTLAPEELERIESILGGKNSQLRQEALSILRRRKYRKQSAERLRASGDELKASAADELERNRRRDKKYTARNGYGLYNPRQGWKPSVPPGEAAYHPKTLAVRGGEEVKKTLLELDALIHEHRDDEYLHTHSTGMREMKPLGWEAQEGVTIDSRQNRAEEASPELWDAFFAEHPLTTEELSALAILAVRNAYKDNPAALRVFYGPKVTVKLNYPALLQEIIIRELRKRSDWPELLKRIMYAVVRRTPWYFWFMLTRSNDYWNWLCLAGRSGRVRFWYTYFRELPCTVENFGCRVKLQRISCGRPGEVVNLRDYLHAYDTGVIPENEVYCYLFDLGTDMFFEEEFKEVHRHELLSRLVNHFAGHELGRGELATGTSDFASRIPLLQGACYFTGILRALGSYAPSRSYSWYYEDNKATVLSRMLKVSQPFPGEDADLLRELLAESPIPEKRLIEAAMYAPSWLPVVGEYLGVPELSLAGWYFHAHINENFSPEKEIFVARYSAVTPQEFNDGAFDSEWFHAALKAVGEEMFDRLYDAARYVSSGAHHRRAQIFADAARGRLTAQEIEENLRTKRNKEFVMAYGIAPVKEKELLHRYQVLQQFRKESRQFGSQRQTSEKLAFETAIGNLARTAGYEDVTRFLWRMESEQFGELEKLFLPHREKEYVLRLEIRQDGSPEVVAEKGGKVLKAVPAALRKNTYVEELRVAARQLREQRSRARQSLENAMIRQEWFDYSEIAALAKNPVLGALVNPLLFRGEGDGTGFWKELPDGRLRIAHPIDLLDSGRWAEFQRYAVENRLLQPFKQIFRELYTPNEDEKLNSTVSRRYAGNQIMPKKGIAMLRTRGWTVDVEGLQKVHHRAGIIARITAKTDWFAPSEIEPPVLEDMHFESRKDGKVIPFDKIPPVLFSEVMRDLDLLVSAAHAGGVDPEASHSTVEMRAALIGTMLPLFKLKNVEIKKSHAFIQGHFGEYTVHLGSGVCHRQAAGMIHILPVHSQNRGRVFLPFLDDDPKTAEIVTKILFLAEDGKIKDPNILNQLRDHPAEP